MSDLELISHIENYVGKITSGYKPVSQPAFSILAINQTVIDDCSATMSLGLSLRLQVEVMVLSKMEQMSAAKDIVGMLSEAMLNNEVSADYKTLIGPFGLVPGIKNKTAFLLIPPIYFDEKFNRYKGSPVTFVWAIPISDREVDFIRQLGVGRFLEAMETTDSDLSDLDRQDAV